MGLNEDWFRKHIAQTIIDLDDRYTQEIESLDIPAMQIFRGLEGGEALHRLIREAYEKYINSIREKFTWIREDYLEEFNVYTEEYLSRLIEHFHSTLWTVPNIFYEHLPINQIDKFENELDKAHDACSLARRSYYDKKKNKDENDDYHSDHFQQARRIIWEYKRYTSEFKSFFNSTLISLSINPKVLITGKAGNGKSHLIGDIASKRMHANRPSLVVLGNQLLGTEDPWTQIMRILAIDSSKQIFLTFLNDVGELLGERLIFFVDALNEGNGKYFWKDNIASFIDDFSEYPFIGLAFSVRSTYLNSIIPEGLLKSDVLSRFDHHGFKGIELEAVKHFCKCFGSVSYTHLTLPDE